MPHPLRPADIPAHTANIENGKLLYNIGGCISCHMSVGDAAVPSGGKPLSTPIGMLYPPNLTPDPETGLGKWSDVDFVNAMQKGLRPDGSYLIPAFPYTSYAHMKVEDVMDIKAYLASLPPVQNKVMPHAVVALPLIRRGLGLWQWIGLDSTKFVPEPTQSERWNRGAYLVIGPGHCAECHTPRTLLMSSDVSRMFAGGPHPDGKGQVPSLRSLAERGRYKDVKDLVLAFQNGEELGYDKMSSGGMGEVRKHIASLPQADVEAIAEYLMSLK
ncbi:MAG: c-type cytochrome [Alphaproteobacteria bacterium]|nr:c-type cytochrome [Alphaproteobacteria bacterium]